MPDSAEREPQPFSEILGLEPEAILRPGEVARLFDVNAKTVSVWARQGKIEAFRTLGGHRRFLGSAIIEAVQRVTEELEGTE